MLLAARWRRNCRSTVRSLTDDRLVSIDQRGGTRGNGGMRIEAPRDFLQHRKSGPARSATRERPAPFDLSATPDRGAAVLAPSPAADHDAGRNIRTFRQQFRSAEWE